MGKKRISDELGQQALGNLEQEQPTAIRYLLQLIEDDNPGHSVELRVPPFGAIQCVSGLNHRRGTPPNVVEIDPADFISLCLGELSWIEAMAAGRIRASGVMTEQLIGIFPLSNLQR